MRKPARPSIARTWCDTQPDALFDNYPGAPRGGVQVDRPMPDAWFSSSTSLSGNNVHVYSDPTDAN